MLNTSFYKSLTSFSRKEAGFLFSNATRRASNTFFDIKRCPPLPHCSGRLILVIPRKVGSAPQRNKIRRRLKMIFFSEELFKFPYNWLFFAKAPLNEMSFEELKGRLKEVIKEQ